MPEEIKIRAWYNLFPTLCFFALVDILFQDFFTPQAKIFLIELVRDFFLFARVVYIILLPDPRAAKSIDATLSDVVHLYKQVTVIAPRGKFGEHVNVQLLAADSVLVADGHSWEFDAALLLQANL